MEKEKSEEMQKWLALADELQALAEKRANGGPTVVHDIIKCLRAGNVSVARHIAEWDHDKILNTERSYEDMRTVLKEKLFADMEHPWVSADKWYEQNKGKAKV